MSAAVPATTAGPARDTATVTALNLASRVTGLVRVLVVGGALGATRLGDTFQASNQISNVLFEFLAAGTLSAVLVPGLVGRLTTGNTDEARAFAGAVLGRVLCVLGPIVVVGLLFARPVMRIVFSGNDASTFDAQVRLGTFLLFFVLPQLLLYAWGAVLTALLHASGRFAAAAFAPIANNVVVSLAVGLFWARGARGLSLAGLDKWLLGLAVLGGVAAMTLVPAMAAHRAGLSVRPSLRRGHTLGAAEVVWATLVLLPAQAYLFGSLVVAGRVDGGVVACQIGFTLFLLPHALLAHPLTTVLYPRIASDVALGESDGARQRAGTGLTQLLALTAGPAALLAVLAPWLVRALVVGSLANGGGPRLLAASLAAYAVGLPAYAWMLFATRVAYAHSDVRLPALAALGGGVAALVVLLAADGSPQMVVRYVSAGHSVLVAVAVVTLLVVLAQRRMIAVAFRTWVGVALSAGAAASVARIAASALDGQSRAAAFGALTVAGIAGLAVYLGGLYASGLRVPSTIERERA